MSSIPRDIPNAIENVVEDEEVWMDDGNLVVSVRSDDGVRLFKIHKSALSRQSPIFKSMFSLPQGPAPESEAYMGLPTVHLTDNHDDVKKLLQLLYTPMSLASATPFRQSTQDQLVGPLRLATKYEMEGLRGEIISALVLEWPKTLEQWDLREETIKSQFTSTDEDEDMNEYYEMYDNRDFPSWTPDPIEILHIAQECDVPELLPAAFFHLNRSYHDSFQYENEYPGFFLRNPRQNLQTNLLTPQDYHQLLIGRQMLAGHIRHHSLIHEFKPEQERFHRLSRQPSESEKEVYLKCAQAMNRYKNSPRFLTAMYSTGEDPLFELSLAMRAIPSIHEGACYACHNWVRMQLGHLRQSVWNSLEDFLRKK